MQIKVYFLMQFSVQDGSTCSVYGYLGALFVTHCEHLGPRGGTNEGKDILLAPCFVYGNIIVEEEDVKDHKGRLCNLSTIEI